MKGTLENLSESDIRTLRKNTDSFMEKVFCQQSTNIVGFKMWRSQNADYCANLLENSRIAKIIYERDNKLAQYSSILLARKTGVWNISRPEQRENIKSTCLEFDRKAFTDFVIREKGLFKYYREHAKGSVKNISFDKISSGDFSEALEFLGASLIVLKPSKLRLHTNEIITRFDRRFHDEIVACLAEIGKPEWVQE